jgi:hypothetical protein
VAKRPFCKYAVCPYYKDEEQQKIRCEGPEEGTALHLTFAGKEQMRTYRGKYCEGKWKTCMFARALNEKYDYEP